VLEAGYEDHILASSDFASDPEFKAAGGAGYSSVSTGIPTQTQVCRGEGVHDHKIMVENPKRFLTFVPRKTALARAGTARRTRRGAAARQAERLKGCDRKTLRCLRIA